MSQFIETKNKHLIINFNLKKLYKLDNFHSTLESPLTRRLILLNGCFLFTSVTAAGLQAREHAGTATTVQPRSGKGHYIALHCARSIELARARGCDSKYLSRANRKLPVPAGKLYYLPLSKHSSVHVNIKFADLRVTSC